MGRKTMSQLGALGLYTETPLHCGAESGSGYVDLPIQRERHTGYPLIPGSTVKGVLRDEMLAGGGRGGLDHEDINRLFGTVDAKSPGRISFGDGILAAFPVRSSAAPFHWATCPFVLERVGRALGTALALDDPAEGCAWANSSGEVLLEELRLEKRELPGAFTTVATALTKLLPGDDRGFQHTRKVFPDRLLVVTNDAFRELTEVATEVVTRIKLNALGTTTNIPRDEHKEIKGADREGNLFVQELMPPETLFLSALRAIEGEEGFADHAGKLRVIRLGGDETIGRGVTHVTWVTAVNGKEG
jgi:CRISPR-associated protein Cmr4